MKDLSSVEPKVKAAESAVGCIQKEHLQEIKALNNPPAVVKMVLEAVLILLGKPTKDWKAIKSEVASADFMKRVSAMPFYLKSSIVLEGEGFFSLVSHLCRCKINI